MCSNTSYLLPCCFLQLLLPPGKSAAGSVPSRSGAQTEGAKNVALLRLRHRRTQPRRVFRVPLILTFVLLRVLLFPDACLLAVGFHRG